MEHISNISVKLEIITPKRAKMLLGTSQRNRKINPDRVAKYANDMKSGKWSPATLLIIDEDGQLVDAHHRLNAVIAANTSVRMVVVSGLEKRFVPYIDTGRPRSAGDMLKFCEQMDGVASIQNKAAMAKIIIGTLGGGSERNKFNVSYDMLANFMIDNIEVVNYCYDIYRRFKPMGGTLAIGAAVWFIHHTGYDNDLFELFVNRVVNGEDIHSGMPEYAVRNAFISNGRSKCGATRQKRDFLFFLMAWADVKEGHKREIYRAPRVIGSEALYGVLHRIGYVPERLVQG